MDEQLSEYERQRLATIAANHAKFLELGLAQVVPSKVKRAKQPKAPAPPPGKSRKSRRLSGEAAREVEGAIPEELQDDAWRDPHDVSQMSQVEKRGWCDQLREAVLSKPWFEALTEEQQQRVRAANSDEGGWLGEFTWFTVQFDMQGERPMSRTNATSVLQHVMLLVSGAGISCKHRDGSFAAGRPLRLGITPEEVDDLRAEAQVWCPLLKPPADIVGRRVNGVEVPRNPPNSGPRDKSNGWLLNHPLKKVKIYCEFLEECKDRGFEATLARLTGSEEGEEAADGAAPRFAYREGEQVQVRRRGAWMEAWIENVNEDDGTYDVEVQDSSGEEEERVSAERIRPRA